MVFISTFLKPHDLSKTKLQATVRKLWGHYRTSSQTPTYSGNWNWSSDLYGQIRTMFTDFSVSNVPA